MELFAVARTRTCTLKYKGRRTTEHFTIALLFSNEPCIHTNSLIQASDSESSSARENNTEHDFKYKINTTIFYKHVSTTTLKHSCETLLHLQEIGEYFNILKILRRDRSLRRAHPQVSDLISTYIYTLLTPESTQTTNGKCRELTGNKHETTTIKTHCSEIF